MIIGIDASRANHREKTGVEWYAWHIIEGLKRHSEQYKTDAVQFVLYSDEPLRGELANLPPGWSSKVLGWPPKRFWTQVRLSWQMLVHPPDVLFIPAHVFPIIHPKKTVMTIHDVAAARFPESYSRFERWYSLSSARFAAGHLWRIVVPSAWVKGDLLRLGEKGRQTSEIADQKVTARIQVIPHGYDGNYKMRRYASAVDAVLQRYKIAKPFILSIGRLEEKKNTRRMIEAFALWKARHPASDLRLLLAGKPGYGYENVAAALAGSRYKEDIICPGWVPVEDATALMQAAEVFLFPSLAEGFGMPLLEAFAAGTPVVASQGSSLEEVGGDACVYAAAESTEDIAGALERVLGDDQLRDTLRTKGLERVQSFSWEKAARETWNVLAEDGTSSDGKR